jgi:putative transposase
MSYASGVLGVMRHARFSYRVGVSAAAERVLLREWDACRWVWNQCVAESKAASREGRPCGPAGLGKMLTGWREEHEWLREGSSVAQQQTVRDFGKSRAQALKDRKSKLPVKQRAGMPRFRKRGKSRPTMNYTRQSFTLRDGKLTLAGGIAVRVVWSRELPSEPTSVRIYRDALGHWHASFVVEKASAGYLRAKRQAARTHVKVAAQRRDTARKWAKRVVHDHDAIAVEDFKPKFLAKSTMARKAADASIGATKRALIEMGAKHGRAVHLVSPAFTTMDCGNCGARARHRLPLSERTCTCTACGISSPRDRNSAPVMLARAGLNPDSADRIRPRVLQGREAA